MSRAPRFGAAPPPAGRGSATPARPVRFAVLAGMTRVLAGVAGVAGLAGLLGGCESLVVDAVPVATVEVVPSTLSLLEGEDVSLSVVLRGFGGETLGGREVEWSTGNPDVAIFPAPGILRGIAPGETLVRVRSEGVEGSAPVLVQPGPRIAVDSLRVEWSVQTGSPPPDERRIRVTNAGGGTLAGLAVSVLPSGNGAPPSWLEASLLAAQAPTDLRMRALADGLASGRYEARVLLSSAEARNSPVEVQVALEVLDADPRIGLSPSSVAFAATAGSFEPASQTIQVTNPGGGTLQGLQVAVRYPAGGPSGWLTAQLQGTQAPTGIVVEALARNLPAGSHRATVRVTSPVANPDVGEVEIVFNVSAPASFAVEGSSRAVGAGPGPRSRRFP
jgi:hypothetical protein